MLNSNKHRFFLFQILKEIYSHKSLSVKLGFKGGTALMFFHELPRFSVDLDFNLLESANEAVVFDQLRQILLKYGNIHDEAIKHHGILCVLDYGVGERKLKLEVSNRNFNDRYEIKNLLGINVRLMRMPDMFAHKLCAMLDRSVIANRDIFDCWFFMSKHTAVNAAIVENRMGMPLAGYLQKCIDTLEGVSDRGLLNGLGDLMDEPMKQFVRTKLRSQTIQLLKFYQSFPMVSNQ